MTRIVTPVVQEAADDRSGPGRAPARRRTAAIVFGALVLLTILALLGPRARFEGRWVEPDIGSDVDAYLASGEAGVGGLKPGEAKGIVWADPGTRESTPLSVVYLHGFSADRHEVEPLVTDLGKALGANVFFQRLRGHGRDGDALGEASVADWLADASEAVAVGARVGDQVVLVGTSTGGTLALWAAAQPEAEGRIAALVLISPNLGLRDPSARALTWPWGGVVARAVVGPERCFEPETPEQALHWTVCYPTRALLPMMAMVGHVRSMDLGRVRVPTLLFYSSSDQVVDAQETARILGGLGGDGPTVHLVEDSGDPAAHVIAGAIMSPGTTDRVRERILDVLEEEGLPEGR
ncbi:MAG TPA: alpha/beta fold hydrolase [Longimicrobiales bacterium]|nr:alpha/beta fold hydrolase [Longimicrobiales bacterium]